MVFNPAKVDFQNIASFKGSISQGVSSPWSS